MTRTDSTHCPSPAAAGRRVLVVDASPLFRAAVAAHLEGRGYDVVTADNGPDALGLLPGAEGLVFDTELPGLDGTRLLAALSREGRLCRRAVVALTDTVDHAVVARLRALGARQVLLKSFVAVPDVCRAVELALPLPVPARAVPEPRAA